MCGTMRADAQPLACRVFMHIIRCPRLLFGNKLATRCTLTVVTRGVVISHDPQFSVADLFFLVSWQCGSCATDRLSLGTTMATKKMAPVHPGEILDVEFLQAMGITEYRLAKGISVSPRRINEIIKGSRSVTANTALRLARFFGTSDRFC